MKKLAALLLAGVMALSLSACGGSSDGEGSLADQYSDRERSFTFCYYEGGYGSEWIEAVVKDYMDNFNEDVYISLKPSTDSPTERTKIESQTGTYDLYRIEVGMFDCADSLYDLTSFLDMAVPGEEGKTVKDKIPANQLQYYSENGKWYQIPATNYMGWNWTYNKTLLDETLGEGSYKLPNTTNEFLDLGDQLFDKGVFLTAFAGQDTTGGADYLRYGYETWFAQMTGLEGYNHYFNCEYNNGGSYTLSKDAPKNIEQNKNAIEKTYQFVQEFCQGRNKAEYMHSKSESLTFLDAQFLLFDGGYKGSEEYPIAFYYNTAVAETEMSPYVEDGIIKEQEIHAMKMPVISAIIERTPSIKDDATLSAVVDFVDGKAESLPAGVTDNDAAIVKEARNMMSELVCREFVVSKNAKNTEDVLDFLAYLTSDRAQKLAAQKCNGIPMLAYNYVPTEEDMGFEFSTYTQEVLKLAQEATIIDIAKSDKPAGLFMGMNWYADNTVSGGTLTENLYARQGLTYDKIYQSTMDSYKGTWADRMAQFLVQNQ